MKKGFTLAEVLVTLGLIGVVAAMTLPALNVNIQKQQIVPGLLKGMNSLAQINKIMLHDNNARSLSSLGVLSNGQIVSASTTGATSCYGAGYLQCISTGANKDSGLQLAEIDAQSWSINASSGSTTLTPATNLPTFLGTDGISYSYKDNANNFVNLILDINGAKGPNFGHKDAFIITVLPNGEVVAYGSNAWRIAVNGSLTGGNWECTSGGRCPCANNQVPQDSIWCAGAIIDNGNQVRYKL